ncbi:MAG: TRAP transporter substrate-binding protein [Desulfobacteraceae bacterium]
MNRKRSEILLPLSIFLFILTFLVPHTYLGGVASAENLPQVNWRMQSAYPPPEELFPGIPGAYGQALKLAEMVEKASDGKFKIQVYPAEALFGTREVFNAVKRGAIEMAWAAPLYWGGKMPEAAVQFGLPGYIVSYEQAKKMVWDTDWLRILRRNYEKHGVYLLADTEVGQYNLILDFPCHEPSDLKGKKIRATGMMAKALKLWGGVPVKTEPSEIYVALQRGTIEGVLYPAYSGITYNLFEVAKYAAWPGLSAPLQISMITNMDAYQKLPEAYKELLNEEAEKWSKWCYDVRGPAVDKYVREHGPKDFDAKMIDLGPEAVEKFSELTRPIWATYRKKSEDCAKLQELLKKAGTF